MSYQHSISKGNPFGRSLIAACILSLSGPTLADTVPNEFQSGETASAAEVNENFAALAAVVSALEARVETLEAENADLQAELDQINESELFEHEDFVADLDEFLDIHFMSPEDTAVEGPILRLTGANFQVINAAEEQETPDGTGNLVVGYAEARFVGDKVCSEGVWEDQAKCEENGHVWAHAHNSGSHNIVGGTEPAYSQTGGIVLGQHNAVTGTTSGVLGGFRNLARGPATVVTAGRENTAIGRFSNVSTGRQNTASGVAANVSGGSRNTASSYDASVSGGEDNTASGDYSTVSGGLTNMASGDNSSVSGGWRNTASGGAASISGGDDCEVSFNVGWGAQDSDDIGEGDC